MMIFNPIDDQVYDESATLIIYCKLFKHILDDFITRDDAIEMMKSSNLPVNTNVVVNAGQGVSVAVLAGTGSTVSPGKGTGTGNAQPIYDGRNKLPADEAKAKEKDAIKDAGGQATDAVLNNALGG